MPNPKRDANPFVPSDEQDWVKVDNTGLSTGSRPTSVLPSRDKRAILPPPSDPSSEQIPQLPPRRPTMELPPSQASMRPVSSASFVSRSPSAASISSMTSRKPAPVVPKKPSILSSQAAGEDTNSRRSSVVSLKTATPPSLPPPRRSMASGGVSTIPRNGSNPSLSPMGQVSEDGDRPMLPPRRAGTGLSQTSSKNLLDERDEESLNGWEVLKPG